MIKGIKLIQLRNNVTLSQTEAARRLGISKQTLYKYEKDIVTNIPSDVVERMAKLYETTPAYIMGWEDETGSKTPEGQIIDAYNEQYANSEKIEKAKALYNQYESLSPEKQAQFENFLKFLLSEPDLPYLH